MTHQSFTTLFPLLIAGEYRQLTNLPVQICGAWEATRSEDGTGMDLYPNIKAAHKLYPDLPCQGTECIESKRFFGPIPHMIDSQPVLRYETLAARLRFAGHKFTSIDEYAMELESRREETALLTLLPS